MTKSKLRIKIETLVSNPVYGFQQGRPVVIGYEFPTALKKFADDPLPITDGYDIGKTAKQVTELVRLYDKARYELIDKLGKKTSTLLKEEIVTISEKLSKAPIGKVTEAISAQLQALESTLAELLEHPDQDVARVDEQDKETMDKFNAELKTLQAEEVELWLDRKITPPKDSKMKGNELMAIEDIINRPNYQ